MSTSASLFFLTCLLCSLSGRLMAWDGSIDAGAWKDLQAQVVVKQDELSAALVAAEEAGLATERAFVT